MPDEPAATPAANDTDVYAIHGADPDVLAYAMAKYSRSALTLRESLAEISSQRAEQFLNTFYFQYGHRSIADLAHVAFAVERLSLLAAIALVDEPRWDGQERSTRYQDFRKSGFYTPHFDTPAQTQTFTETAQHLFDAYQTIGAAMLDDLKAHTPRPASMDEGTYTRTLRARAFDMARYLLPLATNTSLGQITNARTLEGQISRLLGSEYAEVRELGDRLRTAAAGPAWNVNHASAEKLVEQVQPFDQAIADELRHHLLREVRTSPTLVKYTAPSDYDLRTRQTLAEAARELMRDAAIAPMPAESPNVDFIERLPGEWFTLEIDIAASMLYPHTHFGYRQLRESVASLNQAQIEELIAIGTRYRGPHDELRRSFAAAQGFRFDILMDIGGFRDMHRHRRCTQLLQPYTTAHGYEVPDFPGQPQVTGSSAHAAYTGAIERAFAAHAALSANGPSGDALSGHFGARQFQGAGPSERVSPVLPAKAEGLSAGRKFTAYSPAAVPVPQFNRDGTLNLHWGDPLPAKDTAAPVKAPASSNAAADYVLPLATRCRSLFTMDFAEALYISELRSTPAGHWSYRHVAWQMYRALAKHHPALAKHVRIRDPHEPVNLLER